MQTPMAGDLVHWTRPGTSGVRRRVVLHDGGPLALCEWLDTSGHRRRGWLRIGELTLIERQAVSVEACAIGKRGQWARPARTPAPDPRPVPAPLHATPLPVLLDAPAPVVAAPTTWRTWALRVAVVAAALAAGYLYADLVH